MDCQQRTPTSIRQPPDQTGFARPVQSLVCWVTLLLLTAIASESATAQATPAFIPTLELVAESPTSVSDVGDFNAQLQELQRQIDDLKFAQPAATQLSPAPPTICCEPAKTKPSYPTARLTGFFQADAVWFDQSMANMIAVGNGVAANGDAPDGADFRRARLAAVGEAWDNISYMFELDFALPGRPSFMDVWLEVDDAIGTSDLRIGQFRQPFGMGGQTSVKNLTFLERALPFALLPFRQIGAMLHHCDLDESLTYSIAGFRFPTDTYGGNVGDNGGYGMASRLTALLIDRGAGRGLLHVGGGYGYLDPSNDLLQYQSQPEIFVSETGGAALVPVGTPSSVPPFVNTGLIPTDHVNLANAELAVAYGSFYAQSEAIYSFVKQQGGPDLIFPGVYLHAGYFLTGESRTYDHEAGVFDRVTPCRSVGKDGGIGAWEIAGRWSHLDLTDENIQGGRLNDLTAGLNWYLNPNTKFQFNYIHSLLDSPINGDSEASIFATRVEVVF